MLTKIIDRSRFCKTHRYFKSVWPADAFPVLLQYYNHHIVIISCASHSKYGPYSENMTAKAGRKESRLFLDSYSVPRSSLEIDTDRWALCCGGAVPTQGTPHRLRMLCGAARRLLCAQSRRASKNAKQPSDKGILLAASGFPAAFAHRSPGCKFARQDRPAAKAARLSAPLAFRPDKRAPKWSSTQQPCNWKSLGAGHKGDRAAVCPASLFDCFFDPL